MIEIIEIILLDYMINGCFQRIKKLSLTTHVLKYIIRQTKALVQTFPTIKSNKKKLVTF